MLMDSNAIVSVTEANHNFTRVARLADSNGHAVIFKNNRPKYLLINLSSAPVAGLIGEEKVSDIVERMLGALKEAASE